MQQTNTAETQERYEEALQEIRAINQQLLIAGLREQELASAARASEERARQAQQTVILQEQEKAVLAERTRIAEDFHDTLAQYFFGINIQLELAEHLFTSEPQKAHEHLQRARNLTKQSIDAARRSIRGLHPQELAHSDLPAALAQIVEKMQGGSASVRLVIEGTPGELSPAIATTLFRIGQESLTNALRHACASQIIVTFTYTPAQVRLQTTDDGKGFDSQGAHEGFGLIGLRERAARVGGELTIQSTRERGTEITVTVNLPLEP